MLWETKQREREIKHSRVSDLPPLNTVMLMHSGLEWLVCTGCSVALHFPLHQWFSPPKKEAYFNTHKHLFNHLNLESGTSRKVPHKCLFFRISNKQSLL